MFYSGHWTQTLFSFEVLMANCCAHSTGSILSVRTISSSKLVFYAQSTGVRTIKEKLKDAGTLNGKCTSTSLLYVYIYICS